MDQIEITELEKELLAAAYPNESRIREEGILFETQREGLRMLREGISYLEKKYLGHPMSFLSFAPANKLVPFAVIRFQYEDSEICRAFIIPQNGEYVCTDTFYSILLEPQYDNLIREIFAKEGYQVKSFTEFPNPVGKELGENADVAELLRIHPKIPRITHLFIPGQKDKSVSGDISRILHEKALYGAYTLFFTGETPADDVKELEAGRSRYERDGFNCFDIE